VRAHAQKPDFVFCRKGRVHLNRRGASVQSTAGSRGVRISGSNAGYTLFRGSVKGTGYPLHSPVSPSLPSRASPCAITFQRVSTKLKIGALRDVGADGTIILGLILCCIIIIIISNLSNDRSKASSKTIPPHSAI
jgi:hypothetical protein